MAKRVQTKKEVIAKIDKIYLQFGVRCTDPAKFKKRIISLIKSYKEAPKYSW